MPRQRNSIENTSPNTVTSPTSSCCFFYEKEFFINPSPKRRPIAKILSLSVFNPQCIALIFVNPHCIALSCLAIPNALPVIVLIPNTSLNYTLIPAIFLVSNHLHCLAPIFQMHPHYLTLFLTHFYYLALKKNNLYNIISYSIIHIASLSILDIHNTSQSIFDDL